MTEETNNNNVNLAALTSLVTSGAAQNPGSRPVFTMQEGQENVIHVINPSQIPTLANMGLVSTGAGGMNQTLQTITISPANMNFPIPVNLAPAQVVCTKYSSILI